MDYAPKTYTARQLLGLLEREVILRGRLPLFSELAYHGDGPSIDVYQDVLGDGDWASLQSGLSAWLGARGYQIDRAGKLVARLPALPKPAPVAAAASPSSRPAPSKKKTAPPPPRRRTMAAIGEVVEQDWTKLKIEQLADECNRAINKRFPPHSASGQNAIGNKIVHALLGLLTGHPMGVEDGRQLVRTLLLLIFPKAAQNQLSISPLFWREDPLGGLISRVNEHLYGDSGLYSVAEAVERLGIDYAEMADLLAHNDLTLVFSRVYSLPRHEVDARLQARRAP